MKNLSRFFFYFGFLFLFISSETWGNGSSARERWAQLVGQENVGRPGFAYVENNSELPNVLLYGDSISIGYTQRVRENLSDRVNVYRLHTNGGESDTFIEKMTTMHRAMQDIELDEPWQFNWDVIHFNVGLHDLKYLYRGKRDKVNGEQVADLETYKENLTRIVDYLRQLAPDAQLIFATTTPVPEDAIGRFAGDALKYNEAALSVLKSYPEIWVNDLYELTLSNHSEWWSKPGNVHFNEVGIRAQGDAVSQVILRWFTTRSSIR